LPAQNVEITESKGGSGWGGSGGYGPSRFDNVESFGSSYTTPGWQRAQANRARGQGSRQETRQEKRQEGRQGQARGGFDEERSPFSGSRSDASASTGFTGTKRAPLTIEGELVAKSTGTVSEFSLDDRVFHQKFGYGQVVRIDGNKLTIAFEKAGEKKVVDSFVGARVTRAIRPLWLLTIGNLIGSDDLMVRGGSILFIVALTAPSLAAAEDDEFWRCRSVIGQELRRRHPP